MEQLQHDARMSLRRAYALGRFENLNIQWVKYLNFCIYFELTPFPATTLVLVWYVQFLSHTFRAHASIVGYLSGIKTLHTLLNFSIAGFRGFLLKLMLRGLRRDNEHVVHRARPMTPAILHRIHGQLNHNNPVDVVFWGICLYAFLLLFRKLNLIPDKVHGFDGRRQLRHADCVVDHVEKKVTVGIRWSKNHQFSCELLTFPLPAIEGSVLCPYVAINNIKRLIPATPNQHLFQLPKGGSFTYRRFQNRLRTLLKKIGIPEAESFSSHSFHRGGTTFSFLCGIPTEIIKILGNWSSDAFLAYLEFPLETRTAACELIRLRLIAMERRRDRF